MRTLGTHQWDLILHLNTLKQKPYQISVQLFMHYIILIQWTFNSYFTV